MKFAVEKGCFRYPHGDRDVLKDVTFEIESGEVMAVLGANGIGKTTLLRCMMGLLNWHSGKTLIDDVDIKEIPVQQIWRTISYVPQAKNTTLAFTALDMVVIGRSPHIGTFAQPKDEDITIAKDCLKEVGATKLETKLCSQMSGGELQLVLIARALAAGPKLLVLDEPESGLDFKNQLIILGLIKRLAKEKGIAAIINTHYPQHALELADKTLMLYPGCRFEFGNTRDVIDVPHMREAFSVNVHIGQVVVDGVTYDDLIPLSIQDNSIPDKK